MDLLEIFNDEGVTANDVTNLDLSELQEIGVSLDRAEQMHRDIKETERKDRLRREEDEEKKRMQVEEEERKRKEDEEKNRMQLEEEERKKVLLSKLQYLNCVELYEDLVSIGCTSVFSIDKDALKKIGLNFMERKNLLDKIQSLKDAEIEGNILSAML